MQGKEPSLRFSGTPEDKLKQYQDTLVRLRHQTDELDSDLLHPVAMQLADFSLRQSNDPDTGEAHTFLKAGDDLAVARQAVRRFSEYDLETLSLSAISS